MPTGVVLLALAGAASTVARGYTYDPSDRTDPFDTAANAVSSWLQDPTLIDKQKDGWGDNFCSCMQNGYIASWYQYASAMYLIDTCTPEDGFVMRTGHLQHRHTEPLQSMMSCDALKLMTYCFKNHAEEALGKWHQTCREAHYTVVACDVDCSAATPRAGGRGGVVAALAAAGAAVVTALLGMH
mmetsp:Transcript_63463/g.185551  ORF Transcript_63463/g.185551 Transcript_63463/m.185551 type:complete len:184 (+) Transcript_63463:86-637(+)